MKVKIADIAILNASPKKYKGIYSEIQYLDTSSVDQGRFLGFQTLDVANDDIPSRAQRAVKDRTIVISSVRPNLKHYAFFKKPDDNVIVSSGFITVDANESKIDAEYLYYALTSNQATAYLDAIASTAVSSYPSFNPEDLGNYEIEIPESLDTQRAIAKILSDIDSKISNNAAICSDLEAMAKLLYDYWFIQFDFPDENGKPYKSSGGKMFWNEELKREIPDGWEIKKLKEIENSIITGKTPSTKESDNFNGDIPFITIGDIRGNTFIASTEQTLSEKGANSQRNKFIPDGALCVTCIASPGLLGFATQKSQTNQQINTVICSNPTNKWFLYFAIRQSFEITAGAKMGNTFANMNKDDFSNIRILYSNKIVEKYANMVDLYFMSIKERIIENKELASLRDFLLPMLMNGQVKIKE